MLSVLDVQKALGIGKNQIYNLVRTKDFPAMKVGGQYLIPKEKFEEWMDKKLHE